MKQLIEEGGRRAKFFTFLAEHPSEILTTMLLGNNFVNIFTASLSTTIAQKLFANDALSISVGVTTLLILIFGEIIPKTFARNHSEKMAPVIIFVIRGLYYILFPLVKIFMMIIELVLGKNAQLTDKIVTMSDIEFLVNEAEKEQSIDAKQIDMLNSILEFPTIKVKDIMVPRTQIHGIKADATYDDVISLIKEVAHSRYPVFDENLDQTLGFLHVKDLAFVDIESRDQFDMKSLIKDPFYVYDHMKIQAVFDHMNRKKVHLALVKDENGVVVGIVSLEDIIEEIFGEIQDEHDDEEDGIPEGETDPISGNITLPASINLRDLDNEYEIDIPSTDSYSTLSGFLLERLGSNFPSQGQVIEWEKYRFTLVNVDNEAIEEVLIEVLEVDDEKSEDISNQEFIPSN